MRIVGVAIGDGEGEGLAPDNGLALDSGVGEALGAADGVGLGAGVVVTPAKVRQAKASSTVRMPSSSRTAFGSRASSRAISTVTSPAGRTRRRAVDKTLWA
jgi:hypothetical protein